MLLLRLENKGDGKIREAARKLLVQHIPSLAPKRPVYGCVLVLFISQKPDALPAP